MMLSISRSVISHMSIYTSPSIVVCRAKPFPIHHNTHSRLIIFGVETTFLAIMQAKLSGLTFFCHPKHYLDLFPTYFRFRALSCTSLDTPWKLTFNHDHLKIKFPNNGQRATRPADLNTMPLSDQSWSLILGTASAACQRETLSVYVSAHSPLTNHATYSNCF